MSLIVFFVVLFFKKHGHTTRCSAGQSQTCSHSLQAIHQYAGPTGRETCGLIYEKVFDFFFFLVKVKHNPEMSTRTFEIKFTYFPWQHYSIHIIIIIFLIWIMLLKFSPQLMIVVVLLPSLLSFFSKSF